MSKMQIDNYRGSYVEPFRRITVKWKGCVCRFCQSTAWKGKYGPNMTKEARKALVKKCEISVGSDALEMIVFSGPGRVTSVSNAVRS